MISRYYLVSILVLVTLVGCKGRSPGADLQHATLVTFAELKEATKEEAEFWWCGSDKKHHYFQTKNGFYRLSSQFKMPSLQFIIDKQLAREMEPGAERLPVCIKNESIEGSRK